MSFWRIASALVAYTCGSAVAQEIAPELLALSRIKVHLQKEFSQLPNYTCLETISRFRREAIQTSRSRRKIQPKMLPLDTVRLEVAYSDHREWYSSPGARSFRDDSPEAFIGSGMFGNGAFALATNNLFLSNGAAFKYAGRETVGGRITFRYDVVLSRLMKPLHISLIGGSGTVGEEGSVWVDIESLDLVRLELRAAEIPPFLPLAAMSMTVRYARTRLGKNHALLPQEADVHLIKLPGEDSSESFNHFEFTHCRVYQTQSNIRFDAFPLDSTKTASDAAPTIQPVSEPEERIPALLPVTVQLRTPITEKETVGTQIEGIVAGDVRRKGKIIIPSGSAVRGRIRRLEKSEQDRYFIVGLEFTEVQVKEEPVRFYADLMSIDKTPGIRATLSKQVLVHRSSSGPVFGPATEEITLRELPGVASFFVQGGSFTIPAGFRTFWRTRGLLRQ